jgi:hypothetical protein
MRRAIILTCLLALLALTATVASSSAARGDWYWSPGLCKSRLKQYGVEINDGRTFRVSDAFCVGVGGLRHCEWTGPSHVKRLYDQFHIVVRSPDGSVRRSEFFPTGKASYDLEQIRLIAQFISAARFNSYVAPITSSWARNEQAKGCRER